MTISLAGVFRVILGVVLAIALLFLAGVGMTRYLLARLATPPPRPTFTNDPSPSPIANSAASPVASPAANPVAEASPSPSPLSQGYSARVTQPIGLIIRQEPSVNAVRLGGVEFNREVTVLEDAPDGTWQKIRFGNLEGWVKGGNTERVN